MQAIQFRDVTKRYGSKAALADVSVTFEPGTVHALLGPNGAGKTTLFRLLLGLTEPGSGTIAVPDVRVGCGFQEPQLYGGLTVRENLALFADLTDASESWVAEVVDRCGLDRVSHRQARELSAGFAKRLDLALALIDRPQILLLDEPLADVDEEYRTQLSGFFADYATTDRLVVAATHQLGRFEPIVDRATVLSEGRVVWSGDPGTSDLSGWYSAVLDADTQPAQGE